jgi:heme-degrading monooxygenase HmoA
MTYMFMVIHHPKPEHRDDLIHGMVERAELMATTPGFIEAGPWEIENDQRIVGISRWESKEAFAAGSRPDSACPLTTYTSGRRGPANCSTSRAQASPSRPLANQRSLEDPDEVRAHVRVS